ncbi:histidine kinase [Kineosporia rhizophila]|uniref:GAF domain-containing sensor histidine kinase n=1 Tax=Kineosporia TaxID=49184 RepID=UPI001E39B7A3|nr:GAF domain-containing sensor histidine kinase [Kineosporia sp. NBRC 101677]MCE0535336.1 histidine kinase [Kineosporia rhizophila]
MTEHDAPTRRERLLLKVLRPTPPPLGLGVVVAAGLIAAEVFLVHLLTQIAPDSAFGALFLFGVLVISASWEFGLALATSAASAAAYAYVHVLENSDSLVPAVIVFTVLALLTNVLVGQSRLRAAESEQRRREADLLAELARTMLREVNPAQMLDTASTRLAEVLELPPGSAVLGAPEQEPTPGQQRILLHDGATPVGSLMVPGQLAPGDARRVRRVVPALEALLAAARDRETLHRQTADLARQQAALRRTATLVASRAEPDEVHGVAASELARSLDAEHVSVVRFENPEKPEDAGEDGARSVQYEVLAAEDEDGDESRLVIGERFRVGGHNVCTIVFETGEPVAVDYAEATGPVAGRLRRRAFVRGIGVPITVDGRTWGAVVVGIGEHPPAPDIQARMTDFADLIATAVYNSETRAQLTRSRARVVAAADQARRTIERDLHDGAQQRIVSLGLELRATQAAVPAEFPQLRGRLDHCVETLSQIHTDLQELSRGIHPAILSRGGLAAALKTLARRSPVPVSLSIAIPTRLPDAVEVAAYFAAAEALTNTAKYAQASEVTISARTDGSVLDLVVTDDGVGGARTGTGSGLIGLHDRIDVAGGTLAIVSPPGAGTSITIRIPYRPRA